MIHWGIEKNDQKLKWWPYGPLLVSLDSKKLLKSNIFFNMDHFLLLSSPSWGWSLLGVEGRKCSFGQPKTLFCTQRSSYYGGILVKKTSCKTQRCRETGAFLMSKVGVLRINTDKKQAIWMHRRSASGGVAMAGGSDHPPTRAGPRKA